MKSHEFITEQQLVAKPGFYYCAKQLNLGKSPIYDANGKFIRNDNTWFIGSTVWLVYAGERWWIKYSQSFAPPMYAQLKEEQVIGIKNNCRYLGSEEKLLPTINAYKVMQQWHRGSETKDRDALLTMEIPPQFKTAPAEAYRGFSLKKKDVIALKRGLSIQLNAQHKTISLTTSAKTAVDFAEDSDYGGVVAKFAINPSDVVLNIPKITKFVTGSARAMDFENEGEIILRNNPQYLTISKQNIVKLVEPYGF